MLDIQAKFQEEDLVNNKCFEQYLILDKGSRIELKISLKDHFLSENIATITCTPHATQKAHT